MAKSKKRQSSRQPSYQPSPRLLAALQQADRFIAKHQYEEAGALLTPLVEQHPRSRPLLMALLEIHQGLQQWHTFAYYCEQLLPLERGADRADTLNNLIFAYTQLAYPALVWQTAQELVRQYPDHREVENYKRLIQTTEVFLQEQATGLPISVALSPNEEMEVLILYDRVRFYTESDQAEKAIAAAEALLAMTPDFIPVLNNLSLAHFTAGHTDQAISVAQRVLALAPDNYHALSNLTRYTFLTAQFDAAHAYAARLQQLTNDYSDLELKQAEALAFLGDDEGVRDAYRRAKKRTADLSPFLLHLAAVAYYRLGDEQKAWRLWQEAVKQQPPLSLAQENLADQRRPVGERDAPWYWSMFYWFPGSFNRSLKQIISDPIKVKNETALQKAFSGLLDNHPFLTELFPHILERSDRMTRQMVITLIRIVKRPELVNILVDFALGRYGPDDLRMDAIQFVSDKYPELLPEDRRVTMWIKGKQRELLLMGWKIDGEAEVPTNVPDDVWNKHLEATELLQAGQLDKAKSLLQEVIAAAPDFPAAYNHLTLVYQMEGRNDEAREMARDVYARFPDYLFARVAMTHILVEERRLEEAKAMLDPLLRRRRFHFSEFRAVAQGQMAIALAEGSQEGARQWLNMWSQIEPDHPDLAQWRLRIEGRDKALKSLPGLPGFFGRRRGGRPGLP